MRLTMLSAGFLLVAPVALAAQAPPPATNGILNVFLDCNAPACDFDHFRREIVFVNWVRDRQDAQVHVLVTGQGTGGGGIEYRAHFIGRPPFGALQDTLRYQTRNTDTGAELRDQLTTALEAGLVRYAARTPALHGLAIRYEAAPGRTAPAQPQDDPWDYWVFRTRVSGAIDGESQESGLSAGGSLSASRTTDALKIELGISGDYRRNEFQIDDTTRFVDERQGFDVEFLMVRSIGPHWSAGVIGEANRSTFFNRTFGFQGGPAIEFSVFPYEESSRKQITVLYAAGVASYRFEEETILGRTAQTLPLHHLEVSVAVRQPWGSIFAGVSGNQFFTNLDWHRVDTGGGLNLRVFRGLDFNVNGNFSRIKDQIFLPAGGLSEEEILVRRRQRGTDFRFRLRTGLTYRFGSAFANVVNPRLEL